jgi:hypothetical protein
MRQLHFVVVVEPGGTAYVDEETTEVKFPQGHVWDTELEQWEDSTVEEYQKALHLLEALVSKNN